MINEYTPNLVKIKEIIKETNNTNTYILNYSDERLLKDFLWDPGQFMMIGVVGIGESAISISNVEKKYFINMTIRNVGNVTSKIFNMKEGDFFGIRGPYGIGWPLEKAKRKDILIVAGGMGIAPLRGVINYINKNRTEYDNFEIIYGAGSPEDMIFKYDFKNWKNIKNCTLHLTADNIAGKPPFECQTGLVTSCFPISDIK